MTKNILIIGAGNAGSKVAEELHTINPLIPHIMAINTKAAELAKVSVEKIANLIKKIQTELKIGEEDY